MKKSIKAILFDLDGTLLDTALDLHAAMQNTLSRFDYPPIPYADFRPLVHSGTASMIAGSTPLTPQDTNYTTFKTAFLKQYQSSIFQQTSFFPGVEQVLKHTESCGIPWGIVTNKPTYLTQPLLAHTGLDQRCACVICGDTLPKRKPDPDPLLHASDLLGVACSQVLYVGDTHGDIIAAQRAGMVSAAVTYGYHLLSHPPQQWDADNVLDDITALLLLPSLSDSDSKC